MYVFPVDTILLLFAVHLHIRTVVELWSIGFPNPRDSVLYTYWGKSKIKDSFIISFRQNNDPVVRHVLFLRNRPDCMVIPDMLTHLLLNLNTYYSWWAPRTPSTHVHPPFNP